MSDNRIEKHPIIPADAREKISFTWNGEPLTALEGEMIASALLAHGIHVFRKHKKDGASQGIFCANGQCDQCLVLADGKPVKSCMTPVKPGKRVEEVEGLPVLPKIGKRPTMKKPEVVDVPVLVIGGGPAGLSAAIQLGNLGVKTVVIDDKHRLGGKLVLQTHRFFGSQEAVYAGMRGIDIATKLEGDVRRFDCIDVWLNSSALAVFSDGKVGVLKNDEYKLVVPEVLLVAAGAREKFLAFAGNTLPGVYGAGAFQTVVNRDLVRASDRLFIVGGGNVGLIAGYHALQAGIDVVGLVEALPRCGGYEVHEDKLVRMGIPIYTSHTIVSANDTDRVESATIARVDENFRPVAGTEKTFACDTVLIAVGLDPVDEFYHKAKQYGMKVFSAGDAEEIAEASAAMFSGKIAGTEIAAELGVDIGKIPAEWKRTAKILKSPPGKFREAKTPEREDGVYPVLHCDQEIPCNPCATVCPAGLIYVNPQDIRQQPEFLGHFVATDCTGCERCIAICPGLAITLVDFRKDKEWPTVTIPYEFLEDSVKPGDRVLVLDKKGRPLGEVEVTKVRVAKKNDRTALVKVKAPREYATRIAGMRVQQPWVSEPMEAVVQPIADDVIVCRCERVEAGTIIDLIRKGYRDFNEIKAVTRAGMGSCGAKTCTSLIERLFRQEGIPLDEVTPNVKRPLFMEVPLGTFAGAKESADE